MTTYSELLRDPRWQKKRLTRLDAAGWKCERCHDGSTTLNVHHKRYVKGAKPWEYDDAELSVLCQTCHEAEHEDIEIRAALVARLTINGPFAVNAFFAQGAGSLPEHLADEALQSALAYYRATMPGAFFAGRFVQNLDYFGIGRAGFEWLATHADPTNDRGEAFRRDLIELLTRHGAPLLGLPSGGDDA